MKIEIQNTVVYKVCLTLFATFLGVVALGQTVTFPKPNTQEVLERIDKEAQYSGRHMVGVQIETDFDFFAKAQLELLADGMEEWTLVMESADAAGLCVYFDDFHLPVGTELLVESPKVAFANDFSLEPIDASENNDHGRWVTPDVPGDKIVLVYRQHSSTVGEPQLNVDALGYFVTGVSRGGSDPCQVDVACPEGDSWQCERDGVVRLTVTQLGGIYFCSGSMVNNFRMDCRQLLLSAFHCADAVDDDEWAYLKVQYNYEHFECGGSASYNTRIRTGVIMLTHSDDASNQGFTGSDFLLVEVEDPINASWNPFYAGFDATTFGGAEGVGIHHPAGDRKKISYYNTNLISQSIGASGSHWRVTWQPTETDHGVTEGGSSGSPIFNQNHHIVGTLSSGLSACVTNGVGNGTGPYQPDFYGKMSYHWEGNNPIPSSWKLKEFLDPDNTGEKILHGSYVGEGAQPCSQFNACADTDVPGLVLENEGWTISPNPAMDAATIQMPSGAPLTDIRIYDAGGRILESIHPLVVGETFALELSKYNAGLYYVTVRTTDGTSSTLKLIVE